MMDGLEVEDWSRDLDELGVRLGHHFLRSEPRRRLVAYLRGLMAPVERKNGWQLAEAAGDRTPSGMQEFLSRARWDADLFATIFRAMRSSIWAMIRLFWFWMKLVFSRRALNPPACSASIPAQQDGLKILRSGCFLATPAVMATR